MDDNLDNVFILLSLIYPAKTVSNISYNISLGEKSYRSNAIETIDNLLEGKIRKLLINMLEDLPAVQKIDIAKQYLAIPEPGFEESLSQMVDGEDRWLRSCAIYEIGELGLKALRGKVKPYREDKEKFVKDTAERCLEKLEVN